MQFKQVQPAYPKPIRKEDWQKSLANAVNEHFAQKSQFHKVVLLVEDATRPSNTAPVIESLLKQLQRHLPKTQFSLILAGGAHQGLEKENARKVPPNFPGRFFTHNCRETLSAGQIDGVPLWLNREVVEADLRIAVGTVNLHPLAGFSGGAKILAPGVAGLPTIFGLHNLSSGKAGQLETPIRRLANHVLDRFPVAFSVQLLTNGSGEILRIFTGELYQAWRAAVETLLPWVDIPSPGVFATCSAATKPFDQNLLGIFKSLPTVLSVLKPGGTAYLFSKSPLGLGHHLWRLDPVTAAKERELMERTIGNREILIMTEARIPSSDWDWVFPRQVRPVAKVDAPRDKESLSISCTPLLRFSD